MNAVIEVKKTGGRQRRQGDGSSVRRSGQMNRPPVFAAVPLSAHRPSEHIINTNKHDITQLCSPLFQLLCKSGF